MNTTTRTSVSPFDVGNRLKVLPKCSEHVGCARIKFESSYTWDSCDTKIAAMKDADGTPAWEMIGGNWKVRLI